MKRLGVLVIWITLISLATANKVDVQTLPTIKQNPAWSPDGTEIVFSGRYSKDDNFNIWLMNADGSDKRHLTNDTDSDNVNMPGSCWCPGNDRICFSSDRIDNDEIWTMKPDGSDLQRVTNNPANDWEPTWSPDGKWLVFQSDRNGNWEIYKIRSDGTDIVQLTNDPANDWEPNWSPDGDKIVFQSNRTGNWDIWVMDADGSNLSDVTNDPAEDTDPSWSPDGKKIVYSSNYGGLEEAEIYTINVNGSRITRVTYNPTYDGAPSWSPDGKKIAFESSRYGKLDIFIKTIHPFFTFQKGMSYAAWWNSSYLHEESDISLENLKSTGTEWISLIVTGYQENEHSTHIFRDNDSTPSDESIIHAIETIHSLGMEVMLKPHVDLHSGEWREEIWFDNEADWKEWFGSYKNFICSYAQLAESHGVGQFCIGCEFVKTVHRKEWLDIIYAIRENFSGPITYAANWDNYQNISFWHALDFIGIDAYFWLTEKNNPSIEELIEAWKRWEKEIEEVHNTTNKNITFTEIGYRSINGCNKDPWNWWRVDILDLQEQADCYEAALHAFYGKEWFSGIYWWMWYPNLTGGTNDKGYTPYGKPAEEILKNYYLEEVSIEIYKPDAGKIYFMNREIMAINSDKAIIIGKIIIEANTSGNKIEFYIDDELKSSDTQVPYEWLWDEFAIGTHEIKVITYDNKGNEASDEINVTIFNL
ncbi:MAG: DUF5050 domain-containing protein [Candidatus Thermoplasmatota archaeon]|nr:DUF5050 domain-containing protein [Candidatus Thermoplasmatota archaeon]